MARSLHFVLGTGLQAERACSNSREFVRRSAWPHPSVTNPTDLRQRRPERDALSPFHLLCQLRCKEWITTIGGNERYRSWEKLTLTRSVSEDAKHVLADASGECEMCHSHPRAVKQNHRQRHGQDRCQIGSGHHRVRVGSRHDGRVREMSVCRKVHLHRRLPSCGPFGAQFACPPPARVVSNV